MAELTAIKVRGPYEGTTGYEHHVREFVRELTRRGIAVELAGVPAWSPIPDGPGRVDPLFAALQRPVDAQVSLQFCMPHQVVFDPNLPTVNHTMFEGTRVVQSWVEAGRGCRLILVPTASSRRAWAASGAPENRLRLAPLGIDAALYGRDHAPLPIVLANGRPFASYRVRVLNVSEWGIRKNLNGLLRTWLRATDAADSAALVIKIGLQTPGSETIFAHQLRLAQLAAGRTLADAAPIHVVRERFTDEAMPRLYAAATHYWSMSHGEGWDLPMMEAAASGAIPIAPDHSAYPAYLDAASALMIPSVETRVHRSGGWLDGTHFLDANWWMPDERAAAGVLRGIIAGNLAAAQPARARILRDFTWQRAADCLLAALAEALAPAPPLPLDPLPATPARSSRFATLRDRLLGGTNTDRRLQ